MINLFSGNTVVSKQNTNVLGKETSSFSAKTIAILGFSAVLQTAPVFAQEKDTNLLKISTTIDSLQPQKQDKLQVAKAITGDSVTGFMLREFGRLDGWNMLVEKGTGKRVLDPRKDLIAGKDYILARNEEELQRLIKIFQKRNKTQVTETKEVPKYKQRQVVELEKQKNFLNSLDDIYENYILSIGFTESRGNYKADNSKKATELGVEKGLHAKGMYQLTNESLASFGIKTPDEVKKFKKSPSWQEEIMRKYTERNFNYVLKIPEVIKLLEEGLHPSQALAVAHHRGPGGLELVAKYAVKRENPLVAFYNRLQKIKADYFDKTTYSYVMEVGKKYNEITGEDVFSALKLAIGKHKGNILVADNVEVKRVSMQENIKGNSSQKIEQSTLKISQELSVVPETSEPKYVPNIASNDESFINPLSADVKISKISQTVVEQVELIDKTPKTDISSFIKTHYKKELLLRVSQMSFTNLSEEAKARLIDKLSKVDDLEVYYQRQIDYHRNILITSGNDLERQKSKMILPLLERLLSDTSKVILALNDEKIQERKTA